MLARTLHPPVPDGLLDLAGTLEAGWADSLARLQASGSPLAAYNNIMSRNDISGLIPEEVSNAMLTNMRDKAEGSAALKLFTRVPVGRAQVRFPVLSALPVAYWVAGETGLKQATEVNWANKFLNIEEIAVIVPIPEASLDDSAVPIWEQVQPLCEEAAARQFDATVFFGDNAPGSFPQSVVAAAIAAGNVVTRGTAATASGGVVEDHSKLLALLEADGFDPTGGLAARTLRGAFRSARSTQGERLEEVTLTREYLEVDGVQYTFPMRGLWPAGLSVAEALPIDGTEFVAGVRQDITWKLLTEAVITDNSTPPVILYNLAQQDMVAMRMTMRLGWQVSNNITYDQPNATLRYPAGVLRTPAV